MGQLKGLVLPLPGHTPDHVGYQIGNCVYAGDTIFLVSASGCVLVVHREAHHTFSPMSAQLALTSQAATRKHSSKSLNKARITYMLVADQPCISSNSARYLLSLPSDYRIFSGHDYPAERAKSCFSTVHDQRAANKHMSDGISLEEFRTMRSNR